MLAQLAVSKYGDHQPLYRLEDILARHGVEVPRSLQCRWMARTAELLEPIYELMVRRVLSSLVIHTDDTTVPVQDRSLPKTRTGRFWVYCGDAANDYSVYDDTPSRQRDGPAHFLQDYQGYLQADAFAGYDGIYATQEVKQVLCWAHARRKFYEARTVQPQEAHRALAFIKRLYRVERKAQKLIPDDFRTTPQAREEWCAKRYELRQEHSLAILTEFHEWLQVAQHQVLPKSPMGQAISYVLPRWDGLVRYCEDGRLAIDNNLAERTLRPCAIGRKNWLFVGNDNGGRTAAILFSMMASAKSNELEPWLWLRDVINRMAQLRDRDSDGPSADDLEPLLPDRWLTEHPEAYRPNSR